MNPAQREEKQIEATLDTIQARLNDLKIAIGNMIHKLDTEHETINYPQFLDNFALITTHLTGLTKILAKDQCPILRNRTVLPLMVSPDRDDTLVQLTQGRVPVFSHDIVPDYLRTRPDPVTEQKMLQYEQKAANISPEAAVKQVTQFNKAIANVLEMVGKAREEWESESNARTGIPQTSSMADTQLLVATVNTGKGFKPSGMVVGGNLGGPPAGMMVPPGIRTPMQAVPPSNAGAPVGKPSSTVKTNIKSAMPVHQFNR